MQHGQHDAAREWLEAWLLAGDYKDLESFLVDANPELYGYLRRFTVNYGDYDSSGADRLRRARSNKPNFEVMLSMLVRMLHREVVPFRTVLMSLYALHCQIHTGFWKLLASLGILMSKNWTRDLAKKLGETVADARGYPSNASAVVGKGVYDNLLLHFNSTYESSDEAFCRIIHQTNQWSSIPLLDVDDDAINKDFLKYGGWNMGQDADSRVLARLEDSSAVDAHRDATWSYFIDCATTNGAQFVLYRPDHPTRASARAVDRDHIPTRTGTAACVLRGRGTRGRIVRRRDCFQCGLYLPHERIRCGRMYVRVHLDVFLLFVVAQVPERATAPQEGLERLRAFVSFVAGVRCAALLLRVILLVFERRAGGERLHGCPIAAAAAAQSAPLTLKKGG